MLRNHQLASDTLGKPVRIPYVNLTRKDIRLGRDFAQASEMFRDANLWRSKIWRLFILHYSRPNINSPPAINLPCHQAIKDIIWRTYYQNSFSSFLMKKYTLSVTKIIFAKMSQKPYDEIKKYKFWGKKWAKFKLKHRKAQKSIWWGRFGFDEEAFHVLVTKSKQTLLKFGDYIIASLFIEVGVTIFSLLNR